MEGPASAGQILQLIRRGEVSTRKELLEVSGLARSTLAQRLLQLQSAGYLQNAGQVAGRPGRPTARLRFDAESRIILAAALGATHARLAVVDGVRGTLAATLLPLRIDLGPQAVLSTVSEVFAKLLAQAGRSGAEVAGIGIGVPGPVDFPSGVVTQPPIMPGWHGFDIRSFLGAAFDVPVFVDNDANLMGLGEHRLCYPDAASLLFVKVATGVGAGLILHGQPERGVTGAAGSIGHVRLDQPEVEHRCACGAKGCLAVHASGSALARTLSERGVEARTSRDVVRLVREGNGEAIAAVRSAGRRLGEVLATAVALLNPAVLVIGGDMAETHEHFLLGVREAVYERTVPIATRDLTIAASRLGDQAAVEGARVTVLDQVFSAAAVDARLAER